MAKALMGHVGIALDTRAAAELRRLRERVRLLENDNERLREANNILLDQVHDLQLHQEMVALSAERELDVEAAGAQPALA